MGFSAQGQGSHRTALSPASAENGGMSRTIIAVVTVLGSIAAATAGLISDAAGAV